MMAAGRKETAPGVAARIEWASLSDVGRVRSQNQDACGELLDPAGNLLLIVADGMGGYRGGATASRLCLDAVRAIFSASSLPLGERLVLGLERASEEIFAAAMQDPETRGMGTTAVALALAPGGEAWVAWVGDSRAYRLRDGCLERLTEDHSLVAEWSRQGLLSSDEADSHPRRNELLRSIGVLPTLQVDLRPLDTRPGDRLLLCSDGLWDEIRDPEIQAVLGAEPPERAVRTLVRQAHERGARDNVTVQVAALAPEPAPAAPVMRPVAAERAEFVAAQRAALLAGESRRRPRWLPAGLALLLFLFGGLVWVAIVRDAGLGRESRVTRFEPQPPEPGPPQPSPETEPATPPSKLERVDRISPGASEVVVVKPKLFFEPPLGEAELASVSAAKREPLARPSGTLTAPDVDESISQFLDDWARSLTKRDYELHRSLGLPATRDQFQRSYGERKPVAIELVLLEESRSFQGVLKLRLRMTYVYEAAGGREHLESDRKILVRETESGLRFFGEWD